MRKQLAVRLGGSIGIVAALFAATPAAALEFTIAGTPIKLDSLITIGGMWRMQERDNSLVGKSSLNPGMCVSRNGALGPEGSNSFSGDTCTTSNGTTPETPSASNLAYVAAPGSYNPNGDNGNLNFEQHDMVHAAAKITSDLSVDLFGFNVFARGLYFFDERYSDFEQTAADTTLQPPHSSFSSESEETIAHDARILDFFVSRAFEIGERQFSVKIGKQVLNWGESSFLALNSLNTISPPNQALLRLPGFDIKELFQPVGMVFASGEITSGLNLEAFYQYDWKPIELDPVGSFFSSSDTLGAGGTYAMLSFGKAPDDPLGIYQPFENPDDPIGLLGSTASRTIMRDLAEEERRKPDEGGQYGAALKMFLDGLNNGTELSFYYANYHSRVPSVSFFAAQDTCVPADTGNPLTNLLGLLAACQFVPFVSPAVNEPIPVDTARLFVEYPEDIHLYGVSFNTTLGDLAWSGEYAFRENLPVQIHTTDLTFAALNPAFPESDYNVGISILPGRRAAVPDFVSGYRGRDPYTAGEYIRGYERMKVGQLGTTFLKTVGGDNFLDASQITLLLELGMTHVLDMPDLSELQFQGAGTDTHISGGGDGSVGYNPVDIRADPDDPTSTITRPGLRQNPTAQDRSGFGTEYSYGYRFVTLTRFDNALFGASIELLNAFFHDVEGVAPGLGQNFVEGRKQILSGVRFDYLQRWVGEVRYTWFTGGGKRDALRDRDNLVFYLGYQF